MRLYKNIQEKKAMATIIVGTGQCCWDLALIAVRASHNSHVHVKWTARLSRSGAPLICSSKPREKAYQGDVKGVVCLDTQPVVTYVRNLHTLSTVGTVSMVQR
jgi:hypothetical protein